MVSDCVLEHGRNDHHRQGERQRNPKPPQKVGNHPGMVVAVMTGMVAVFLTGHNPAVGHGMGGVMGMTNFRLRGRVMMLMVLHVEIVFISASLFVFPKLHCLYVP